MIQFDTLGLGLVAGFVLGSLVMMKVVRYQWNNDRDWFIRKMNKEPG